MTKSKFQRAYTLRQNSVDFTPQDFDEAFLQIAKNRGSSALTLIDDSTMLDSNNQKVLWFYLFLNNGCLDQAKDLQ